MTGYEVEKQHDKIKLQGTGVKVLLWLIGLSIGGAVVCVILAVLKVAVATMATIAGILAVLFLLCVLLYNTLKYKAQAHEYRRQLDQKEKNSDAEN